MMQAGSQEKVKTRWEMSNFLEQNWGKICGRTLAFMSSPLRTWTCVTVHHTQNTSFIGSPEFSRQDFLFKMDMKSPFSKRNKVEHEQCHLWNLRIGSIWVNYSLRIHTRDQFISPLKRCYINLRCCHECIKNVLQSHSSKHHSWV